MNIIHKISDLEMISCLLPIQQVHYLHHLLKQVRIYHWKFCITWFFLIRLDGTKVFQFLIICIQIRFMFGYVAQNIIFNLLVEQLKAPKWKKFAFFLGKMLFGFIDVLNLPLSKNPSTLFFSPLNVFFRGLSSVEIFI